MSIGGPHPLMLSRSWAAPVNCSNWNATRRYRFIVFDEHKLIAKSLEFPAADDCTAVQIVDDGATAAEDRCGANPHWSKTGHATQTPRRDSTEIMSGEHHVRCRPTERDQLLLRRNADMAFSHRHSIGRRGWELTL